MHLHHEVLEIDKQHNYPTRTRSHTQGSVYEISATDYCSNAVNASDAALRILVVCAYALIGGSAETRG